MNVADRIELLTDQLGSSAFLLDEAGTTRIASLGNWSTTHQDGWTNTGRTSSDTTDYNDLDAWLDAVKAFAANLITTTKATNEGATP